MRTVLCWVVLVISAVVGIADAVAQPSAPLAIHSATLHADAGVITIAGTGLVGDLAVTVNGEAVAVLPGGTATQIDVPAAALVLHIPGTYRLTVVDPVRQIGDAFVVASQPGTIDPVATLAGTPSAASSAAPVRAGTVAVSPAAATAPSYAGGSTPMSVIEDSGAPYRTAIGKSALANNTTGTGSTASGYFALFSNTTGSYNTASGVQTLESNTTGSNNTASGSGALYANTTGFSNTASGMEALVNNTTGFFNTASGSGALYSNTTGATNTANGLNALYSNLTGDSNTAAGTGALFANTSGANNAALGYGAGHDATTGSFNLFLGAYVAGTAADTNTIRIGLPYSGGVGQNRTFVAGIYGTQLAGGAQVVYIDANGQLGTAAIGSGGGGFLPMSQLQQHVRDEDEPLRDQPRVIADLRGQIARLVATNADLRGQIAQLHATDGDLRVRLGRLEAALARVAAGK